MRRERAGELNPTGAPSVPVQVGSPDEAPTPPGWTRAVLRSASTARGGEAGWTTEVGIAVAEELAQFGAWEWDLGSGIVYRSPQIARIVGGGDQSDMADYLRRVHPEDRSRLSTVLDRAVKTGEPYETEHRLIRPDGEIRTVLARGCGEFDDAGAPIRLAGSFQDVTEARNAATELRRSRDLFAGVLDAATEQSIIATDRRGIITVFNTGAERMLGYSAAQMIGRSPESLHDPDEIRIRAGELGIEPGFDVFLAKAAAGGSETRQWTYVTRDGRRLQALITVTAMHGPEGEVTGFIKVGTDITERLRAQEALRDSELRLQDMFRYAPTGMMLIGIDGAAEGRFIQVNPTLSAMTGYSAAELLTMGVLDLTAPEERQDHQERFGALASGAQGDLSIERHWIRADGKDLWVQFNVSPRRLAGDAYVIGQAEDITSRKTAEQRLTHQVLHDGLTGLPNRLLLMDRIEHGLASAERSGRRVGVLYLDLDGFKSVNDRAGHAAGDELLVLVAGRLTDTLRPGDTVARLGGDEFVIVCDSLDSGHEAERIADRVIAAIGIGYCLSGVQVDLTASIGVCLSDGRTRAEDLLHSADQAMYAAKEAGKGRVRVSGRDNPEMLMRAARAARAVRIGADLARAQIDTEMVMFGQPVHDLTTGAVVAVENLVRWQHPTRGLLGTGEFLDVAESGGQILEIGRRALEESCRMAAEWERRFGSASPDVHVNVSGRQLESRNLRADVLTALERYGLDPHRLVLELTETHMPLLSDSLRKDLHRVRAEGLRVAIDDVGTGYSSLTRITELPIDILKIDVSFVGRINDDPASAAVAQGILTIGSAMNMQVIAEGVETDAQADRLREFGCHLVQGYLYSRPLPEAALLAYLQAHQAPALRLVTG